jgi:glyoxalase family protein
MENTILGIHHITAIAGDTKRNFDFTAKHLDYDLLRKP